MKKFNDWIAEKMSYALATMFMFYIITFLVIIPLLYSQPTSIVAWASYLSSVVFQGIALPVLGYTSRKNGQKTDELIDLIYKLTKEDNDIIKKIESEEISIEEELKIYIK
jgi:hypothetical protein